MDKEGKSAKLTTQETEAKIYEWLAPWLIRMLKFKQNLGFVRSNLEWYESNSNHTIDTEWLRRINRIIWVGNMCRQEDEYLKKSMDDYLDQITVVLKQTEATHIQKTKCVVRACLLAYRHAVNNNRGWSDAYWMTDGELEDLACSAVFGRLESWLSKDSTTHRTIEEFAKYGFGGETVASDHEDPYENRKAKLWDAYIKYEDLYRKGQMQKKQLSLYTHPVAYKRGGKRKLDLIELAWCEAWRLNDAGILKILFTQKTLANRKSMHDAKQNEQLRQAMNNYAQFVERVAESCLDQGKTEQYKAYVANCCLIRRLESNYHFGLAGHLASYVVEHGIGSDVYDNRLLDVYVSAHKDEEWMPILSSNLLDKNGRRQYDWISYPMRALWSDDLVTQIMETKDEKQAGILGDKEMMRRYAADYARAFSEICDRKENWSWSENDFYEAAMFLKNEYRFLGRLDIWELPETDGGKQQKAEERVQRFLDCYFAYYRFRYDDEENQVKQNIDLMCQQPAKKRRSAKKGKTCKRT